MPAPPNYVFATFAFVAFFLCLARFSMQLHAWNVGTHLYLGWVGLQSLLLGINSIIWKHNTVNWAPVWCDISARMNLGGGVAIPAAVLCINRRLYLLASSTSMLPSQAEKHREVIIDLVIGIGLPMIIIILSFVVQNGRFLIVEDFGCSLSFTPSWVSVVIINTPSLLLELIAGVYGCLSIHAFYKRRSQVDEHLPGHQNLNSNRYIRVMCFSAFDLFVGIPITMFYVSVAITSLVPGSTKDHHQFSEVIQVPAVVWRATTVTELTWELNRWVVLLAASIFFAVSGFTKESRNHYRAMLQSVVAVFRMITGFMRRPSSAEEITFKAASRELDFVNTNLVADSSRTISSK